MTEDAEVGFSLLLIILCATSLAIGNLRGRWAESTRHREVCPCKYCLNWREKRDADEKLSAAKEPKA